MNYISKRKVINMEQIMNYVKPELIIVAIALYFPVSYTHLTLPTIA